MVPSIAADDPRTREARRILIQGVTGSGKSTLAHAIGTPHGIPAYEVHAWAWQPGWVKTPDDELAATAASVAATDAWVLDSAWSAIRPVVWPRVELLVGLDLPRSLTFARLVRRTAQRLCTREELFSSNTESWRSVLSTDSIFSGTSDLSARSAPRSTSGRPPPNGPPVLRLTSPVEVRAWLASLRR